MVNKMQFQEGRLPKTSMLIGAGGHMIAADHSVTVNLGVYQWTLNFHPWAKNSPIVQHSAGRTKWL